jgi:hypothetical protein
VSEVTGEQLYNELCTAAANAGQSLASFVEPLFNGASWKIEQMRIAKAPRPRTIERVRALVAGRPLPAVRDRRAMGLTRIEAEAIGLPPSKRSIYEQYLLEERLKAKARLETIRYLSEEARLSRRPGQTLQERLLELQRENA